MFLIHTFLVITCSDQQDLANRPLILQRPEILAKFQMHIRKQFLLKRMLSIQA